MINFSFNEQKATQAACRLLELNRGKMNYMKLIELLYLADRKALGRWERPITGDSFVSMDKGTVLTNVLDIIKHDNLLGMGTFWKNFIVKDSHQYNVKMLNNPGLDELCLAEIELLDEIFEEFKNKSPYDMVDYCHHLPEWENPHGSSIPILVEKVLGFVGKTSQEISEIDDEVCAINFTRRILGC